MPLTLKNFYAQPQELCFTANTAGSTVKLIKEGSPGNVTLETSTDTKNWSTYTINTVITLSNIGDKIYWRNTSETQVNLGTSSNYNYKFVMTGSIAASGDVSYLLCKTGTSTVQKFNYSHLFDGCTSLTSAPELKATSVPEGGYYTMFNGCTNLTVPPEIPATDIGRNGCQNMFAGCTNLDTLPLIKATSIAFYGCYSMFNGCTKIKISETQTGEYQTPYRIPTTGTGSAVSGAFYYTFASTGGTFTGEPVVNTTYYTSNNVI